MNKSTKDDSKGKFHEVKGKVKEKVGQVTNNSDLVVEGKAEYNACKVEKEIGHTDPKHEELARLAYQGWQQRGRPIGTPEEDWFRAEEEIKQHLNEAPTATSNHTEPA